MSWLSNFVIVLLFFNCTNSSKVPLLLWTNIKEMSCHKNSHHLTESVSSYFTNEYMNCLSTYHPEYILLFVYDKLGIQDLTLYGQADMKENAFANIHALEANFPSTTLPEVEPSNIVEDLYRKFDNAPNDAEIKIVRLPPIDRSSAETTFNGLRKVDGEVMSVVRSTKGKYIAIVTSENTLDNVRSTYNRDAIGRHLLNIGEDKKNITVVNSTFLMSECVIMTFKLVNLTVVDQLDPAKPSYSSALIYDGDGRDLQSFTSSTCLEKNVTYGNVSVTMAFKGQNSYFKEVNMTMLFNKNETMSVDGSHWWKLLSLRLNIIADKDATKNLHLESDLALNSRMFENVLTAPDNMSFACGQTKSIIDLGVKTENVTVSLQLTKFQVQPFGVVTNKTFSPPASFSQAVDCAGWYTGPIWTGLIVTLLLLVILSYGLAMISQVTTMDRFDDPKRKTISVPQESN